MTLTCEFTVADLRKAGVCDWRKRRTLLRNRSGMKGRDLDALRMNITDILDIGWSVDDALWCLRFCDDPQIRVRAIWSAVLRAQDHAGVEHPPYVQQVQAWLDGDDNIDLGAAAEAAAWAAAAAGKAEAAAAWAAAEAAAAEAAEAAAWAAAWAAEAADERKRQTADIRALFGPGICPQVWQKEDAA